MYSTKAFDQLPSCFTEHLPDSFDSAYELPGLSDYAQIDSKPCEMDYQLNSGTVELYRGYYVQLAELYSYEGLKAFIEAHELPSIESIFPDETNDFDEELARYQAFWSTDHEDIEQKSDQLFEELPDELPEVQLENCSEDLFERLQEHQSEDQAECQSEKPLENQLELWPDDQHSEHPSGDCSSHTQELDQDLDQSSGANSPENCEIDYSSLLDKPLAEPFVFDPVVAYRETVLSPDQDDPYDVFLELNHAVCWSDICRSKLKKKIESTKCIYDKLNSKLKKLMNRVNSQSNQFSALSRAVLLLEFYQKERTKLGQKFYPKIDHYRNILSAKSYNPYAQQIQQLIDMLYNPFHEFNALLQSTGDGSMDASQLNKLQSNLERLCSIHRELNSIDCQVKVNLQRRDRLITDLRREIVTDVLESYQLVLAEEYDFKSVTGGYRQESVVKSFHKILTILS